MCSRCPNQCDPGYLGCNPNRENPPWQRCWRCGALWDGNGTDLLVQYPTLTLRPDELR
jgi:hypothetical protein